MPSTYRQISRFHEDGYGEVTVLFVVSDEYDGLFATSGHIDVGIFELGESSKDLDQDVGVQVDDEVEFSLIPQSIETAEDQNAIDFVLDAQDKTVLRFCAVFINPADVDAPVIDESEFTGIVRPEMQAEDLKWYGGQWESNPDPLREWKCTGGVFYAEAFDQVSLEDLIEGNPAQSVPGISASFESTEVANRTAYFSHADGRKSEYVSLVSLNNLVDELIANLTSALTAQGLGTFNVTVDASPLGIKFTPAHYEYRGSGPIEYIVTGAAKNYNVRAMDGDAHELSLGNAAAADHIFISYLLAKHDYHASTPGSNPETYSFQQLDSITDLLFGLAVGFGCYLQYEWTSPTDLTLTFTSRPNVRKHEVWLKDADKADLDVQPAADDKQPYYCEANGLAGDSYSTYRFGWDTKSYLPSPSKKTNQRGDRLLLSVSVTHRRVLPWYLNLFEDIEFPHNVLFTKSGSPYTSPTKEGNDSTGTTTAIYMQKTGDGEYGLNGQTIFAPAYRVHANVDGTDRTWSTLAEYVNFLNSRDSGYYEAEYNIEVPYSCAWRKSADGSHPDDDGGRGAWKNLQLGCKITLDSREWIVVGYKRKLGEPGTKLRLHQWNRFAFSDPVGLTSPFDETVEQNEPAEGIVVKLHTAGDSMNAGDYVTMMSDEKVYKSIANHTHFDGLYGVALNDAAVDEDVYVQVEGEVENENWSWTPGAMVFVRTAPINEPNLDDSPLTESAGDEDLYARVGHAVTATRFKLESPRKVIYNPEVSP